MRNSGFIGFSSFAPCSSVHVCPERFRNGHAKRHKADTASFSPRSLLHFVREIADGDVIVFAQGEADQPFVTFNGDDEAYARLAGYPNPHW